LSRSKDFNAVAKRIRKVLHVPCNKTSMRGVGSRKESSIIGIREFMRPFRIVGEVKTPFEK